MQAIRLTQKLDSDTLYLPQLRPFVGRDVEIIVLTPDEGVAPPMSAGEYVSPLAGTVLKYDEPFEPAVSPDEWEANR